VDRVTIVTGLNGTPLNDLRIGVTMNSDPDDAWLSQPAEWGVDSDARSERATLESALAAAEHRLEEAKFRAAERRSAALRAEVMQSKLDLAEMERRHTAELEAIRNAAAAEAAQIIADARARTEASSRRAGAPEGQVRDA
jgi:hypothetical protein